MKTVVKAGLLIDGIGEPIENAAIIIEDGKFASICSLSDAPSDGDVLDYSQNVILPGFINAHTHLSIDPGEGDQLGQMRLPAGRNILRSLKNIKRDMETGVTTSRIMGEEHYIDVDMRNAIEEGLIEGPRLLVAGVGITATNGHGVAITTADGEEGVRRIARNNLAKRADFLKIFVTGGVSSPKTSLDFCGYTPAEIAVAVDEADRMGTYVAAHAHGGRGVDYCIENGVRCIEHGALLNDSQIEKIIEKDMWVIGTFSILFSPQGIEKNDFSVPSIKEKVLRVREFVAANFSKMIKKGVNIALGTDSMHGMIDYEAQCLVNFGASPMVAIKAITSEAAKAVRMENEIGSIQAGKYADFVVLNKNPLEDISNLSTVSAVYKEGKCISRR